MAAMEAQAWTEQAHGLAGAEDDFNQFLEMSNIGDMTDNMHFDMQAFPTGNGQHMMPVPHREPVDTPMSGTETTAFLTNPIQTTMIDAPTYSTMPPTTQAMQQPGSGSISDIDAQIQFLQHQKMQQQRQLSEQQAAFFMRQSRGVPPTPQSLDLQAANGAYYVRPDHTPTQAQQEILEQFKRLQEQQDMAFTPLASPAVTPLVTQFAMANHTFVAPPAYFSPLSSPALHPQPVDQALGYSANTNSPGDLDIGPVAEAVERVKEPRKAAASKSRAKTQVGKSPIVKPQRRKTASTPKLNSQAVSELAEAIDRPNGSPSFRQAGSRRQNAASSHASNTSVASSTESENGSVSPEALSDMPPPPLPKPRTAKPSPVIEAQGGQTPLASPTNTIRPGKPSPATPASLMRLPNTNGNAAATTGDANALVAEHIDNLELPESIDAAAKKGPKPGLAPIKITSPSVHSPGSQPASASAATFQPLPSPVFVKSPEDGSSASPYLAPSSAGTTPGGSKRPSHLNHRTSKKRGSISSSHASPALRPKISPNIRPLLPGGDSLEDTASRLLTSKSNYQNILEGNRVPGVTYSSDLSTNLTMKRTSHKIAEQGRRNRINSALQEIATLLPGGTLLNENKDSEGDSGDKKDSKNGGTPNSKASTVELAIEYIKQLQAEVAEANKRAEAAEEKLKAQA